MRLLECYIEGFGQIKKEKIDFQKDLTEFFHKNGYGKSTIASFLKAMFYGMKSISISSKDFLERAHYLPFDGSKFGGNVTFEYENNVYKVERFFDKKSGTKDTLNVYKNGTKTDELGENIGARLFGFDVEAFERILFINSDAISISTTTEINKKLNNDLNDLSSDFDLEKILKKLKEKTIKQKDITGKKDRVKEIHSELMNLKLIQNALNEKYTRLSQLKQEELEKEEILAQANKKNLILKDQEHLAQLISNYEDCQRQYDELLSKYLNGLPTKEEVSNIENDLREKQRLLDRISASVLSDDEQNELKKFDNVFSAGIPTEKQLEEMQSDINSYNSKKIELQEKSKQKFDEVLYNKFFNKEPSENDLNHLKNLVDEEKKLRHSSVEVPYESSEPALKKSNKLYVLLLIFSILLIGGGIGVCFIQKIVGILIIVLGGILLLGDGFFYLKSLIQTSMRREVPHFDNPNTLEMNNISNQIKAILLPYGYYAENNEVAYTNFMHDLDEYHKISQDKKIHQEEKRNLEESITNLQNKLLDFFKKYHIFEESFMLCYSTLTSRIKSYNSLTKRQDALKNQVHEYHKAIASLQEKIDTFNKTYQMTISFEKIKEILSDLVQKEKYEVDLKNQKLEIDSFKKKHNLEQVIVDEYINVDSIQEELSSIRNEKAALEKEIKDDELQTEDIESKENQILDLSDEIESLSKKKKIYENTTALLLEAEQKQKDRYAKPVKDKFLKYSVMLKNVLGENILMDKDYRMTFEQNGEQRKIEHLSSGELSICALCFRLALLDNMYDQNQPFMILDDPFVNLDEAYFEKVKELLQEVTKNRQIIYFCCHKSRKLC